MGELGDYWKDVSEIYKKKHQERVAQTPNRIQWCKEQFEKMNIPFKLINEQTGQFNAKIAKKTIVYYCSTGTIMVSGVKMEERGFKNAVRLYQKMWEEE